VNEDYLKDKKKNEEEKDKEKKKEGEEKNEEKKKEDDNNEEKAENERKEKSERIEKEEENDSRLVKLKSLPVKMKSLNPFDEKIESRCVCVFVCLYFFNIFIFSFLYNSGIVQ
jgi:hypothetical protein